MDGNAAVKKKALQRIMALLVALADLAEHAGGRSFPVRWLVLSVLWSAEAVAREFVADTLRAPQPSIEGAPELRTTPEDALLLAGRFLALAAALRDFLSKGRHSPRRSARTDSAPRLSEPPPGQLSTLGGLTPNPNDTS